MGHGFATLLVLAVAPLYGVAPNTVTERAKVEYVKVEEKDCLQPIVHGKDAVLKDYTEAELRWVQAAYPGSRAPQVEAILVLPNGRASLHVSDTITVVTPTGESVRVCFDVNVTTWQFGGPEDDGEGEDEAEPGI